MDIRKDDHMVYKISSLNDASKIINSIGLVDALIHCAGYSDETELLSITKSQFEQQLELSLIMLHELSTAFIPEMIDRNFGRIIFISSVGSIEGGTRQAHYAASKAAGSSYIRSLGKKFGLYGITANSIIVGLIDTPMISSEISDKSINTKINKIAVNRLGHPDEVGHICMMLAADLGGFVNCQSIHVDGGYIAT
jgi:3-oxoacyl-[acyl-carrier protein] reductase